MSNEPKRTTPEKPLNEEVRKGAKLNPPPKSPPPRPVSGVSEPKKK